MWRVLLHKIAIIVFILNSCCNHVTCKTPASARIIGGHSINIKNAPYLVYLRINDEFICGGSLLSTHHVVTAAHCVKGVRPQAITVIGGATYLSENGTRRSVSKVFLPKAYRANSLHMDVAVLKLSSSMAAPSISTIALCDSPLQAGQMVQISGWGLISENGKNVSNGVRSINVPLISKAKCKQMYRLQATLTKSMLCAGVPDSKDSCAGDSGGPLVHDGRLCGIVSWGIGCARSQFPGVYTNVNVVAPFIRSALMK